MPALLSDTSAYAAQVLRNKKVEGISTRIGNPAGRPPEDIEGLKRQRALEAQFGKGSEEAFFSTPESLLRQATVSNVIDPVTVASQLGGDATMILSARGTFYLVKLAATYGPGIYSIDELTREVTSAGSNAFKRPGESTSPILLTSVEFNQVDITSQVPCLNNVKVFYSFGQNFGQVVISGEVLLGPLGDMSYAGVERLVSFFWKHRVSVKRKPIAVSVANNSYFVYLTGLRVGQVNADFHIMPFTMFGTLLDITREQASVINVRGQVMTGGSVEEPSLFEALQKIPAPDPEPSKITGESPEKVALDADRAMYEGFVGGAGYAGAAQGAAAEAEKELKHLSQTQEGKDLIMMKEKRQQMEIDLATLKRNAAADPNNAQMSTAFQESKLNNLNAAIKIQESRVAQADNLAAGVKKQNVKPVSPADAKIASDTINALQGKPAAVSTPVKVPDPPKKEEPFVGPTRPLPDFMRTGGGF